MNIDDVAVAEASRALAETFIEKMEDYEGVLTLIENAEDIARRADNRRAELWKDTPRGIAMAKRWKEPFHVEDLVGNGYQAGWIDRQPDGKDKPCDNNGHRIVGGEEPRIWVDNGKGRLWHGKHNQFLCTDCALSIYSAVPPS